MCGIDATSAGGKMTWPNYSCRDSADSAAGFTEAARS